MQATPNRPGDNREIPAQGLDPNYLISDKGRQFDCTGYKAWCQRKGIQPRYASTGSLRATAVIERFLLLLKDEWLRRIVVPLRQETMRRELAVYAFWFTEHRTHQGLGGRTPNETYESRSGAKVGFHERQMPKTIFRRELCIRYHEGGSQLPIVELRRAA